VSKQELRSGQPVKVSPDTIVAVESFEGNQHSPVKPISLIDLATPKHHIVQKENELDE
jgi:hypothetical protein